MTQLKYALQGAWNKVSYRRRPGILLANLVLMFSLLSLPVLALPPVITPFAEVPFTQGMLGEFQPVVDGHGDTLVYSLTNFPQGMAIDQNTGQITYRPPVNAQRSRGIVLAVLTLDNEESRQVFDATIAPALALSRMEVGASAQGMVQISNGQTTRPFHPGDPLLINAVIKNQYTETNHPFLNTPIRPTFEGIILKVSSRPPLSIGGDGEYISPVALPAQSVVTYSSQSVIPTTIPAGSYAVTLILGGRDQAVPAGTYMTTYSFNVLIERLPHDVTLTVTPPQAISDSQLNCQESERGTLTSNLANIGLSDEDIDLFIYNTQGDIIGSEPSIELPVGAQRTINTQLNFPRDGHHTITTKVFRSQDHTVPLKEQSFEYDAAPCQPLSITSQTPSDDQVSMHISETIEFSLAIDNPSGLSYTQDWELDGEIFADHANSASLRLSNLAAGAHILRSIINRNSGQPLSEEWTITVSNLPRGFSSFLGSHTTDQATIIDPRSTALTLENTYGLVTFNQNVDISSLLDFDPAISIRDGRAGINSTLAPTLNRPATITLYRAYTTPRILVQPGYFQGTLASCDACRILANSGGQVTFSVPGFSTYVVVEDVPSALSIDPISITHLKVGERGNRTITIANTGSEDLTDLQASLQNIDPRYQAVLAGSLPARLGSGEQVTLTLTLTVPSAELPTSHAIGSLLVRSSEITASQNILLDPASFLVIDTFKINGKTSGKLELGDNTFEIRVRNDYSEDMDDVTVTLRILDVDSDDLEEEANSFTLRSGNDKKVTVHIDLADERLDEDGYRIEVEIEGDADDGTAHQTSLEQTVRVDRARHDVYLNRYDLYPAQVSCDSQSSLRVTVENRGREDEDDVEIKIHSDDLSLSSSRTSIDLDDFGGDNQYQAQFLIDPGSYPPGTYPITIELYRDGSLDETQIVNLQIVLCSSMTSSTNTATGSTTYGSSGLTTSIQQRLNNALLQRSEQQSSTSVKASFRDTTIYVIFLGFLVLLVLIALSLAVALALKKK